MSHKSPFKFLDSYEKQDKDIFFGREKETEELYHKVFESKLLLIYGVSGTGKTSIINCGLANKFEDSDWLPVSVRRGRNVVDSMERELEKISLSRGKNEEYKITNAEGRSDNVKDNDIQRRILKLIRSVYLDHFKPVYLIFDQFEEVFIEGGKEERSELINTIKSIIDSDLQCRVIISMREEYIAGLAEFEAIIPGILDNRFRVEKMTRKNAIEVINGPCRVNGIMTEEGFAEELLVRLNPESADIELTYLQVYLDRIFKISLKENRESPEFRKDMLVKAGEVSDLLGDFLDEQIDKLDKPDEALVILKSFVTIKGTKKHITDKELIESAKMLGHSLTERVVSEYLNRFINLRILRDADENGRYELRHDSLAARIFEKISLREKELIEVREFIETAFRTNKSRGTLMSQRDLEYVESYSDELILPDELDDFIRKSRQVLDKNKKALKKVTTISVISFILILLVVFRYSLQNRTDKNINEMAVAVMLQMQKAPVTGLMGAYEIYNSTRDTMIGLLDIAIIDGFYRLLQDSANAENYKQLFDFRPVDSEILSIVFSDNGSVFCGHTANNKVYVWDSGGKELFGKRFTSGIMDIKLSEDADILAVVTENDTAHIIDYKANSDFIIPVKGNGMLNNRLLCFFRNKTNNIAAVNGDVINIYSMKGESLYTLTSHSGRVNSIDISPDSRFIASASCDSKVYVWYFNNNQGVYSIYDSITSHRDTVWSCEFNNTGKYILTASADSSILINDLSGNRVIFNASYRDNIGNYMTQMDLMSKYTEKRRCNASFTNSNRSIIVTMYEYNNTDSLIAEGSENVSFIKFVYNDFSSPYYLNKSNLLASGEKIAEKLEINDYYPYFKDLVSAEDESFLAIRAREGDPVNVLNAKGLPLFSRSASAFAFTPDNKYFLSSLNGNIEKIPIHRKEIKKLLFEMNIFDLSEKDFKEWFIF